MTVVHHFTEKKQVIIPLNRTFDFFPTNFPAETGSSAQRTALGRCC